MNDEQALDKIIDVYGIHLSTKQRKVLLDVMLDVRIDEITQFDTHYFTPYDSEEDNDDANTMFNEITDVYIENRSNELRALKSAGGGEKE